MPRRHTTQEEADKTAAACLRRLRAGVRALARIAEGKSIEGTKVKVTHRDVIAANTLLLKIIQHFLPYISANAIDSSCAAEAEKLTTRLSGLLS